MKVLMIIPAYNEEKSIVNTVKMLKKASLKNGTIDYVVVNDGSRDNTKKVCIENDINFIDLPNNLGIGGAVQTGYKYALYNDYDIAIQTFDWILEAYDSNNQSKMANKIAEIEGRGRYTH